MGKWKYQYRIDFYSRGLFLKTFYCMAKTREDALKQLCGSGEVVIEVYSCRRIDKW